MQIRIYGSTSTSSSTGTRDRNDMRVVVCVKSGELTVRGMILKSIDNITSFVRVCSKDFRCLQLVFYYTTEAKLQCLLQQDVIGRTSDTRLLSTELMDSYLGVCCIHAHGAWFVSDDGSGLMTQFVDRKLFCIRFRILNNPNATHTIFKFSPSSPLFPFRLATSPCTFRRRNFGVNFIVTVFSIAATCGTQFVLISYLSFFCQLFFLAAANFGTY